jgi:hypothetical protein
MRLPDLRPRTLDEDLKETSDPLSWTVEELQVLGGNALLIAEFKAGKTTLSMNLAKSLADGEPFLDRFGVRRLDEGTVAYWNYEMTAAQRRGWLTDVQVRHPERITLLDLRGYSIPLQTKQGREVAVRWLEEARATYWILDPFGRAFGDNENDNAAVGAFLEALDDIKSRAGVQDLLLVTHTGRKEHEVGREHARGATRPDDWADTRWILTKRGGQRQLRAEGRDVLVAAVDLAFDSASRRLTAGSPSPEGGTVHMDPVEAMVLQVEQLVLANPGIHSGPLRAAIKGDGSSRGKAISVAVDRGLVRRERDSNDSRVKSFYPAVKEVEC